MTKIANYKGMIGKNPCQKSLEDILEKLNNPKITKVVTRRLHEFRSRCDSLAKFLAPYDKPLAKELLKLLRREAIAKTCLRRTDMPDCCFTHWQSCLVAIYRNTLKCLKK
jgi:argininosuccinate lyase